MGLLGRLVVENVPNGMVPFAAVACVERDGRWLLGLSTARDDRGGLWCFPGGGIESGESPEEAAVRECREEMGVRCLAISPAFTLTNHHGIGAINKQVSINKPGVAFVHCHATGCCPVAHNDEFSDAGFFSLHDMEKLDLYHNVIALIRRCF